MKRLILLTLATIPLFAFNVNFVYCDYDEDENYWCDEYWNYDPDWYDEYWVYYPSGYYCVYYVWYHPWWWDWYWWHCHWCHHFDWHFFCAGFYIVWYEDGCWWWRPRYGRWVKYKLPYNYAEFRYKARSYGIELPEKPPREINLPYKEKEVMRLTKEKDPQLFARIEKEHKSGNLERMRKEYENNIRKEVMIKNEEYKRSRFQTPSDQNEKRYRDDKDGLHRNEIDEIYNPRKSERDAQGIIKRPKNIIEKKENISEEREDSKNQMRPHQPYQFEDRDRDKNSEDFKSPVINQPPSNPGSEEKRIRKSRIDKKGR
ncbi:MAG: hypothetical protein N3A65_08880 [candidate division WOR-3 bacterium]|nr:hypothetical protein [candidate division WOR-3 bacterium]